MKKLCASKRGFFFTLLSLLLIALFVVYLQIEIANQSQGAQVTTSARITSISNFIEDAERFYLPNLMTVSLRSALAGMNSYISLPAKQVVSLANQEQALYELMTNGSYTDATNTYSLSTTSLNSLLTQFMNISAQQLNIPIVVNYTPYQFTVVHDSPWTLKVTMIFLYSLNTTDIIYQNKTLLVSASVSILGMQDPMYLANSKGYTGTSFSPNISSTNVSTWNSSKLKTHILSKQFATSVTAPSYLSRMANDSTASVFGIESLILPNDFGVNIAQTNKSFVDYLFFNAGWDCTQASFAGLFNITGISDDMNMGNFSLDGIHLSRYLNASERIALANLICG